MTARANNRERYSQAIGVSCSEEANRLAQQVAEKTKISLPLIRGNCRHRQVQAARLLLYVELRRNLGWSISQIGHFVGGRHHTTVFKALQRLGEDSE